MSDSEEDIISVKRNATLVDSSSDNGSSDERRVVQSTRPAESISQIELNDAQNALPKDVDNTSSSSDNTNFRSDIVSFNQCNTLTFGRTKTKKSRIIVDNGDTSDSENYNNSHKENGVFTDQIKPDSSESDAIESDNEKSVKSKSRRNSEKQFSDEQSKVEDKRKISPRKSFSGSSSSSFNSESPSDEVRSQDPDLNCNDNLVASSSSSNSSGKEIAKPNTSSVDSDTDVERNKKLAKDAISNSVELDINNDENVNKKLKPKIYKLLSDGDLSDDESNDTRRISADEPSNSYNSAHEDFKAVNTTCQKKRIRNKKFQKLNDAKRMEAERAKCADSPHSPYSSDSENEQVSSKSTRSKPKILKKKKKDQTNYLDPNSPRNSSPSGSEMKYKKKENFSSQKSSAKRKQQVDPKLEIKSRTQKMIREKRISLPYHQPKKHSLDEFLQRRKNIPSMPLKPTANALALVDEHLAKREKESAMFYKSESDHTDTEDAEKTITMSNEKPVIADSSSTKPEPTIVENLPVSYASAANESDLCININMNCANDDKPSSRISNSENFSVNPASSVTANNRQIPQESRENVCESENVQSVAKLSHLIANTETLNEVAVDITKKSHSNELISMEGKNENTVEASMDQKDLNGDADRSKHLNQEDGIKKNYISLPDSEDFELQIENSYPDTETTAVECLLKEKKSIEERKVELRNHKLALLSQLNVPLRKNVGLNVDANMIIELGESSSLKPGILELQKKFADHTTVQKKDPKKEAIKTSILNVVKGSSANANDFTKEIVDESLLENELEQNLAKPGLKYAFFKEKLKQTLMTKKKAQWTAYQMKKEKLYDPSRTNDDNQDDFGEEKVSRKPHFEPYHPEEEPDDDDLLEDDIIIDDKEKKKSRFVDDEADVSYDEDENIKGLEIEDSDYDETDEEDEEEKSSESETENETEENDRKSAADEEDAYEEAQDPNGIEDEIPSNAPSSTNNDFKKTPPDIAPIFKFNITATDLENKMLGLDSIFSQKEEPLNDFTSSQAFELCSGKFATQRERLNVSGISEAEFLVNSQIVEDSQNINLTLEDTKDGQCNDESNVSLERSTFLLSDESDTEELFTKKKLIRIEDSDDEVDNPVQIKGGDLETCPKQVDEIEENEASNDEVQDEADVEELDDELDYNSEEEIIAKANPAEFFENEAELSESEWDSEDENEKDMDELEKEAGDEDDIDQEKLKEELGKIHMRQMLDDDQNDVRMLQEMLLEDGELHSDNKRERKFQWKGLDNNGFFLTSTNDSDEELTINDENDEQDEQWRKVRHEREMYISQQEKKKDLLLQLDDDDESNSLPLVKFPHIKESSILPRSGKKNQTPSPKLKHPLHSKFKCGSFLSRSKLLLNRIALTVSESKDSVIGGPKNHRNFVFAAVSPGKELPHITLEKTEKRKISSKSIMESKKLKLSIAANGPFKNPGLLSQLSQME